jgi:hypothetical protein
VSALGALAALFGPPATYIALLLILSRVARGNDDERRPRRMTWNHPAGEVRPRERQVTTLEYIVVLSVLLVIVAFEIWFFVYAHTKPWGA